MMKYQLVAKSTLLVSFCVLSSALAVAADAPARNVRLLGFMICSLCQFTSWTLRTLKGENQAKHSTDAVCWELFER